MFATSKKVLIASALALVGLAGGAAQAHERPVIVVRPVVYVSHRHERIDELSRCLERNARLLNRETDIHFRTTRSYRQFSIQVDEIVSLSDHIHDIACRGGELHHLRHDVARLRSLYLATERLFESMRDHCRLDRETVIHLRNCLERVERDIAHLRAELY